MGNEHPNSISSSNTNESTCSSIPSSSTIGSICVSDTNNNIREKPIIISETSCSTKSRSPSTTIITNNKHNNHNNTTKKSSKSHSKLKLKSINKIFNFGRRDHNKNNNTTTHNHKSENDTTNAINYNGIANDQFFINLHRKQTESNEFNDSSVDDLVLYDQRRIVWISLLGLYNSWKQCPSVILYSSIFILPLKQKWIYEPIKYQEEIQKNIVGHISIFQDENELEEFMDLLRWKDGQHLVFWMLDDEYQYDENHDMSKFKNTKCENQLIAPFWRYFSEKLTNLYDPVLRTNYNPLKFNEKFWKFSYNKLIDSKYGEKTHKILMELYFVTMKYKTMQEIIHQSNPSSLNPIISYCHLSLTSSPLSPPILSPTVSNISFISTKSTSTPCDNYGFYSFRDAIDDDIKHSDIDMDDNDDNDEDEDDNEADHDTNNDNDDNESEGDDGIWMLSGDYDENDLDQDEDGIFSNYEEGDDDINAQSSSVNNNNNNHNNHSNTLHLA